MALKTIAICTSLILFGSLELYFPFFHFRQRWSSRILTNFTLGALNTILATFTIGLGLHWIWQQTLWSGLLGEALPLWLRFGISFLTLDAYLFGWHWFMHTHPLGWRFHAVHHTDRTMNTSTAYRFHPLEVLVSNLPKLLLIFILGIPPTVLIMYESLYAIAVVFQHSNLNLPQTLDRWLSWGIVTPNYHRLHHDCRSHHQHTNYASFLTLWDRIFRCAAYPVQPHTLTLGLSPFSDNLSVSTLLKLPFQGRPTVKTTAMS